MELVWFMLPIKEHVEENLIIKLLNLNKRNIVAITLFFVRH